MSDNQVIPEAAVEAAARGIYQAVQANHAKEQGWDEMLPAWQEAFRVEALAALEAAAPHYPRPTPPNQQRKEAMIISEEAVGAALYARSTFKNQRGRDNEANLMRAILEAAAPHIAAQALEDAAKVIIAPGASSVATAWLNTRAEMLRLAP